MSAYLYFCCVCGVIAIGLICGAVMDYLLQNGNRGRHERR